MSVIKTNENKAWTGGDIPFKASYGKLMMWFFLVSDALTFSGFCVHMDSFVLNIHTFGLLLLRYLHIFRY